MGDPRSFFNTDDEVFMPMKRDNIIHRLIYNIYKYNRQQEKYRQAGHQLISLWNF